MSKRGNGYEREEGTRRVKRVTLHFPHHGIVENRGTHWAAKSEEFGLVVYAPSAEKAEAKLDNALTLLLDSLGTKGLAHVIMRFKRGGIPHILVEEGEESPAFHHFSRDISRDLEFAL